MHARTHTYTHNTHTMHIRTYVHMYKITHTYVTGFAKRGIVHASNFVTLRICNSAHV